MQDYLLKTELLTIGLKQYQLCSLQDTQQFSANDTASAALGILSATWSLFGIFWPSGIMLAEIMQSLELKQDVRILEMGCGLALSSIILQQRGVNISASDFHPLAESFLNRNLDSNQLAHIPFFTCDWADDNPNMGLFDILIGSDLLYEPNHPELLSHFIEQHAAVNARILITDPNRRQQKHFSHLMQELGYACISTIISSELAKSMAYKGKLLCYQKP